MDSNQHVTVPLRYGIKKMRKRRDLDALLNHGQQKTTSGNNNFRRQTQGGRNIYSQDKLLNAGSTDDQEDIYWRPKVKQGGGFCGVEGTNRNLEILRAYGIMIVVIIVIMFIIFTYWFNFHLQQQIREYREKVDEIAVNGQLLPRTLQAWHETSGSLLRNQTQIQEKLAKMQLSLQNLWSNFSSYCLFQKSEGKHEDDQKLVADFGAKIEAMFSDLDNVRDHYDSINKERINLQQLIGDLKQNLTEIHKDIDQPLKFNNKIIDLRNEIYVRLNILTNKVASINDTYGQRSIMVQDELNEHKNKLDELLDRDANLTSHVSSLENDWLIYREHLLSLKDKVPQLEEQVSNLDTKLKDVDLDLQNVCQKCEKLEKPKEFFHEFKSETTNAIKPSNQTKTTTTTTTTAPVISDDNVGGRT